MANVSVVLSGVQAVGTPPDFGRLLLETGFFLLQEAGSPDSFFLVTSETTGVDIQGSAAVPVTMGFIGTQIGLASVTAGANIIPEGLSATGLITPVLVWGPIDDNQTVNWQNVNDQNTANWVTVLT